MDIINKNTQTDIRNQLCTTRRKLLSATAAHRPFYNDSTNQTEWCSKTSFLLVYFKKKVWRIFCGIFIFHQVLDAFFCVVYWNNTALCQKGKKRCRNFRVNFLFINITGLHLCIFGCMTDQFTLFWCQNKLLIISGVICFWTVIVNTCDLSLAYNNKCFHTQLSCLCLFVQPSIEDKVTQGLRISFLWSNELHLMDFIRERKFGDVTTSGRTFISLKAAVGHFELFLQNCHYILTVVHETNNLWKIIMFLYVLLVLLMASHNHRDAPL